MGKEEQNTKQPEKKGKGWLSKLGDAVGGAIFESTPEQKEVESSATDSNNTSNATSKINYADLSQIQGIPATMAIPNSTGMFDEKFYNRFLEVIKENNVPGMDYFEFSNAKKALESRGNVAPGSYQSAFIALQSSSPDLTKEVLLQTADFYISKLAEEEKEFTAEMQGEVLSQVESRLKEAKKKQDEIASKQEQIARLQAEIGATQIEISTLNSEAQAAQFKIDSTAKNFKISLEVLIKQIEADKENIKNFIQ